MTIKNIGKNLILFLILFIGTLFPQASGRLDWTHYARISGYGLGSENIESTIKKANDEVTLGIELDNDITGRYDSFLNPDQKIADIKKAAEAAHKIGNYAYI